MTVVVTGSTLVLAARSGSGECFYLRAGQAAAEYAADETCPATAGVASWQSQSW